MAEKESSGEPVAAAWLFEDERYHALAAQVRAALVQFGGDAALVVAEAQRAAVAIGAQSARQLAFEALGDVPREGISAPEWTELAEAQLEALVGLMGDGSPIADHFASMGPDTVDAMRQALFVGIAQGEGARDLADRLRTQAGLTGWRPETVARTEALRAAREASRESYEANSDVVTGYTRLSARDTAVCAACWALDGEEYDTDEIMPTHPNCRCVMVPQTVSWADLIGDDSLPDTRPDIGNAEEVFAAMSPPAQLEILGPARLALWQAGTPLSAFAVVEQDPIWGPTARCATLDELGGDEQ